MKLSPGRSWLLAFFGNACVIALLFSPLSLVAQEHEHDDDHDHEHLHFSHPLVTESPTPDTKIRFDYTMLWANDVPDVRDQLARVEGEYAFGDAVSLALVAPYEFRRDAGGTKTSGLGDLELSLKFASLRYGEHGILLGAGLSAGIPTGSDRKQIGSSHIVELAPFVDAGYKRDKIELVGFASMSSIFNRQDGDPAERDLAFDFSALYHLHPRLETLLELSTSRSLVGSEAGIPQTFLAPGAKIYPFTNRRIMFGTSLLLGTCAISDERAVSISGFYHF
jgi:hypothetical protein